MMNQTNETRIEALREQGIIIEKRELDYHVWLAADGRDLEFCSHLKTALKKAEAHAAILKKSKEAEEASETENAEENCVHCGVELTANVQSARSSHQCVECHIQYTGGIHHQNLPQGWIPA